MRPTLTPQAATTRAARALMAERSWTQRDLAERMGKSPSALRDRLYGYRRWSVDDVAALDRLGARVPSWEGLA